MRCNIHDYDIMEKGIAIGEARGEESGRSEAKVEAARNMLLTDLGTVKQIANVQGLPIETVQQLAEELNVPAE